MTRAAVLGSPIDHSLSPVIHRAAYHQLGLDWTYDAVEVTVAGFDSFVDTLDGTWRGLSVTMPLKEVAAGCGVPDPDVVLTGAANTVLLGSRRTVHNTDIAGLSDALAANDVTKLRVGTVIGNGATARSALVALARAGAQLVEVQGRSPDRLHDFIAWAEGALRIEVQPRSLGAPLDPESEMLVSTVPAEALAGRLDSLQVEVCPSLKAVFDVIYHPWPTALAQRAEQAGLPVISGLDLLVHQARHQIRLMTGSEVDVQLLMSAVRAELRRRQGQ